MSLSRNEEIELLKLLEYERRSSFEYFLNDASPAWNWDWNYQNYIISYLDRVTSGEIKKLMVFCPPRHGKSELVTIRYPVYRLINDLSYRSIIGAYNQPLATKFSRAAKRIAVNQMELASDVKAAGNWETITGGGIRAAGVGSGVTGSGADLVIIDDPVKSREEAESIAYRDRVYDWYTNDLYTRLEPNGAVILIQTRWHEDDLAGRILASEDSPNWTVISLPAEAEENDPLGRQPGEPLCPARFDKEALADKKVVLGSYAYNALYQQHPSPPDGTIIKRSWIKYYDLDDLPDRFDAYVQSWDMAFKDAKSSSYVVGQWWGRKGGDFYLLDQVRDKLNFPATVKAVKAKAFMWDAPAKLVEDKANGPAVIATLERDVYGLIAITPDGGKLARLSAVSPLFEAGNVWVPRSAGWIGDWVEELCGYPSSTYDDQCDCASQALSYMKTRIFDPDNILVGPERERIDFEKF